MVQYYNLTKYSESSGVMGMIKVTSELSDYYFGYSLILILFLILTITTYLKNKDINTALNVSSLFTSILAVFFYVTGIVVNALSIYIPIIIFITTVINKYYTK